MKLLKVHAYNFGSYKEIEFDFNDQGLALIYGATGSGKSTLQDLPVWVLFGQTAKDGNSDDIRSWNSEEATEATLQLEIGDSIIDIVRIRGTSSQNDLYWCELGSDAKSDAIRGKDITETQKLLNERLGIDPYLYTIGAYYNEFSPTGTFFTAKASDRRELFENLANLDLPVLLAERIADARRETKKAITELFERINKSEGRYEQLKKSQISVVRDANSWNEKQGNLIIELTIKSKNFEAEKASKIEATQLKADTFEAQRIKTIEKYEKEKERKIKRFLIDNQCLSCGTIKPKDENELLELNEYFHGLIEESKNDDNPWPALIEDLKKTENHYLDRLSVESLKTNPFESQIQSTILELQEFESNKKELKNQLDNLTSRRFSLEQLLKITDNLRTELLKNTIKFIEFNTNRYLETYFDSEIRVKFELDSTDKLDVLIWKSGHEASYKQLSKGQRGLLKLAFSVSAMQSASDKAGVHFDCLMLDESLDGLDSDLKVKAFNLFNELALKHSSVLVIDHSEALQNLFDKRYHVKIDSDISTITEV